MKKMMTIALLPLFYVASANADCTYKAAQDKAMQVNNMMQVYSRQIAEHMQRGEEAPANLHQKQSIIAEKSAAIGIRLGEEAEKNPNIQYSDKVNPAICKDFDSLLSQHAPADYKIQPVNAKPKAVSSSCTSDQLWKGYGEANKKQAALVDAGKINKQEVAAYMVLMTDLGKYATTDLAKACKVLDKIHKKLDSE